MPLFVHALGTNYVSATGLGQLTGRAFSEGVIGENDLVTSEKGTGSNMSVDVSTGALILHSTTGYGHILFATDITNVPLAESDPLNPRKSLIVAVMDTDFTNDLANDAEGGWSIIEVAGTAAAVPAEPDETAIQTAAGAGNLYEVLSLVDVPANASEIIDDNLTDRREFTSLQVAISSDQIPNAAVTTPKLKPTTDTFTDTGSGDRSHTSTNYANQVTMFEHTAGDTDERLFIDVSGVWYVSTNAAYITINATGTGVTNTMASEVRTASTTAQPFMIHAVVDVPAGQTATIVLQSKIVVSGTVSVANSTNGITKAKLVAYNNE